MYRKFKAFWCVFWNGAHKWQSVGNLYRLDHGPLANPQGERVGHWVEAKAKMVCAHCLKAKLVDLEVFYFDDGSRMVFSPDGNVKLR